MLTRYAAGATISIRPDRNAGLPKPPDHLGHQKPVQHSALLMVFFVKVGRGPLQDPVSQVENLVGYQFQAHVLSVKNQGKGATMVPQTPPRISVMLWWISEQARPSGFA
jgi:hypothetical protein